MKRNSEEMGDDGTGPLEWSCKTNAESLAGGDEGQYHLQERSVRSLCTCNHFLKQEFLQGCLEESFRNM